MKLNKPRKQQTVYWIEKFEYPIWKIVGSSPSNDIKFVKSLLKEQKALNNTSFRIMKKEIIYIDLVD